MLEPEVKTSVNALEGAKRYSLPQGASPQELEKVLKSADDESKTSLFSSLVALRNFGL